MSSYRIVGLPSNSRAVRSGIAKLRGLLTGVRVMLTNQLTSIELGDTIDKSYLYATGKNNGQITQAVDVSIS